MAHSYSSLFNFKTTGLRFFTVYGPWGRPDMALFLMTKNIILDKKIKLFNYGNHIRDFTYVDDVIDAILKITLNKKKTRIKSEVYNIGNGKPVHLKKYIKEIELCLGKKAKIENLPLQMGDIVKTHASIRKIQKNFKFKPKFNVKSGVRNFIHWYKSYFKI